MSWFLLVIGYENSGSGLTASEVCGLDKEPFHWAGLLQMLNPLTDKEFHLLVCEAFSLRSLFASSLSQLLFITFQKKT